MKINIIINIPKKKIELLKKYKYDFERNCEARIIADWQDTYDTEEQTKRRKRIWNNSYNLNVDLTGKEADN